MNDIDKCSTAYHEAGHAVVSTLLGATFDEVSIEDEYGEWVGQTANTRLNESFSTVRRQKIFQIAVAGPLSQLKYRAVCAWDWTGAIFHRTDNMRDFVALSRSGEFQEPPNVSIAFEANNGDCRWLKVANPDDLGDFELLQETVNCINDTTLHRLLDSVRDCLDSEPVWQAVGDVAQCLCQRQRVSRGLLLDILASHGLSSDGERASALRVTPP